MLLLGVLALCGDIANIVLATMSVFTAIVTAIMLYKQYQLQQKQHDLESEKLEAQQLEHQPSFQFKRSEDCLTISNVGCYVSTPIKTTITSMIIVKSSKYINEWGSYVYCHPVSYYHRKGYGTTNIYGNMVEHSYDAKDYNILKAKVQDIFKGFKDLPKHEFRTYVGTVNISDLIKIDYVDMYKKAHTVYYLDAQLISQEIYDSLIKISQQVPMGIYDVNSIKVNDVIRMSCMTNYKLNI